MRPYYSRFYYYVCALRRVSIFVNHLFDFWSRRYHAPNASFDFLFMDACATRLYCTTDTNCLNRKIHSIWHVCHMHTAEQRRAHGILGSLLPIAVNWKKEICSFNFPPIKMCQCVIAANRILFSCTVSSVQRTGYTRYTGIWEGKNEKEIKRFRFMLTRWISVPSGAVCSELVYGMI